MSIARKCLLVLAFAASTIPAHAQVLGYSSTYSGLAFDFQSGQAGFTSCNTIYLDATGDPSNSVNYTVYGDLACAGGSYFVNGSAYFDGTGGFNMQLDLGLAHKLQCIRLPNFTGNCTIYNNSGSSTGSADVYLL